MLGERGQRHRGHVQPNGGGSLSLMAGREAPASAANDESDSVSSLAVWAAVGGRGGEERGGGGEERKRGEVRRKRGEARSGVEQSGAKWSEVEWEEGHSRGRCVRGGGCGRGPLVGELR